MFEGRIHISPLKGTHARACRIKSERYAYPAAAVNQRHRHAASSHERAHADSATGRA
jgi:hypothetical protein